MYEIVLISASLQEFLMKNDLADKIHRLNFLIAEMDGLYHQASVKLGVSDSTMCILYTIQDQGGECLLSTVYKQSGINKQTVNSAIRKMEADGLLYLVPDDGKRKKIVLTDSGRVLMDKSAGVLFDMEKRAFGSWPEKNLDKYLSLMESYTDALRIEVEEL